MSAKDFLLLSVIVFFLITLGWVYPHRVGVLEYRVAALERVQTDLLAREGHALRKAAK